MKTTITVPPGGAFFEGHFPGRPILPGVVELLLVIDALARESGRPVVLRGIAFARLRQLVLPGDHLDLVTQELDHRHIRFDLSREGVVVANGELVPGRPEEPVSAASAIGRAAGSITSAPPLDALLPQRPPMRFVTSIVGETADRLDCAACVPAACGLVGAGSAHVLAGVEAAAQAAATWEAVRRWREGNVAVPRVGYLVALRDVVFFAERIPADRSFAASVRLEAAAPPLTHYLFEVSQDGMLLARGMIATFLAA